nr:3-dehydroquinate synthase [Hyphomicrobium methylovorum]
MEKFEAPGQIRTYYQRFSVPYEYPVLFTRDIFSPGNTALRECITSNGGPNKPRVTFFIDSGVEQQMPDIARRISNYALAHTDAFDLVHPVECVDGGEICKNDTTIVETLQRRLVDAGIDRHSYVVGIGGGAVLDLIGYVAATTHRGIRHIRVPTTVLAQNDSGVGVKNGVNAFSVKNLLGTFQPPSAVINDSAFIDVLPGRDKRAGMAEAVKVALIRDGEFFKWLEDQAGALALFQSEPLDRLIRHCAMLHMRQIAQGGDPFERGNARPLDFGHWAAHKLETLSNYTLRHGEAVAIGIALDTRYSVISGLLPEGDDIRVRRLLEQLGFTLWHEAAGEKNASGGLKVLDGLEEFRAHLGGELSITLLSAIGVGVEVHTMDPKLIVEAIDWLREEMPA